MSGRLKIWLILSVTIVVLVWLLVQVGDDLAASRKEAEGLRYLVQSTTEVTKSKTGESVASQPKAEVSKATFDDLMSDKIEAWEKMTDQKLGRVQSVVEATLTTVNRQRLGVRDTIIERHFFHSGDTSGKKDTAKVVRWNGRFERGLILISGDSAVKIDSVQNRLAILETKDRWKPKHILPWNWGKRKKRIKLLVFNPDTRTDTLSNLSILKQ